MQTLTHLLPAAVSSQVTLARDEVQHNYPQDILSSAEREEFSTFNSISRRSEYVATRRLIKQMAEQMKLDARAFELIKDDFGKPSGRCGEKQFNISIAHTNTHVLSAISPTVAIGVDMEPAGRPVPDILRSRIINSAEASLLQKEETIRIWTIKEALVKLKGKGMRINLNECTITAAGENDFSAIFNDEKEAEIYSFRHDNHWLALAWNQPKNRV